MARTEGDLLLGSPFAQYERVEVTFPSSANTDVVVKHSLQPTSPEDIEYTVLKLDRAGRVYNDQSATRKSWKQGYIYLRCDVASVKATVLLTAPRTV
jgi:hypothetical protein